MLYYRVEGTETEVKLGTWVPLYKRACEGSFLAKLIRDADGTSCYELLAPETTEYPVCFVEDEFRSEKPGGEANRIVCLASNKVRIKNTDYHLALSRAHQVMLPQPVQQGKVIPFISKDLPFVDKDMIYSEETPEIVIREFLSNITTSARDLMTADKRKKNAELFFTPVYFSVSADGPVLSAEIWTWVGQFIPAED